MLEFLTSLPFVDLFIKFIVASTVLLGTVWLMEKIRLINTPDLAELAWKLAIAASFLAMLPLSLTTTTITIESEKATALVSKLNENAAPSHRMSPISTALPLRRFSESQKAEQEPATDIETTSTRTLKNAPPEHMPESDSGDITGAPSMALSNNIRAIDMVALFWVSLAALAIFGLAYSYLRAIRGLGSRARVSSEDEANKTLRSICEKAGIRHVPYLSRSSDIKSPICLPRREICLPDWAFDSIAKNDLESLLAHEVGHMVRRDPLMLIILQFLARLFFFQPLFGLAKKRLTDIAELAADEWAARQLADSRAVASALYACASKIHQRRQVTWGMAMAGRESILKARVERLINAENTSFKTAGMGAKLLLTTALIALGIGLPSIQFSHAAAVTAAFDGNMDTPMTAIAPEAVQQAIAENVAPTPNAETNQDAETNQEPNPVQNLVHATEATALATMKSFDSVAPDAPPAPDAAPTASNAPIPHDPEAIYNTYQFSAFEDDDGIAVTIKGNFALNATEDDFAPLTGHGSVKLELTDNGDNRSYRLTMQDGKKTRTFYNEGEISTDEVDNEAWLKGAITRLISQGYGPEERVERMLRSGKPSDVFNALDDVETDWAKHFYLIALMDKAELSSKELRKIANIALEFEESDTISRVLTRLFIEENIQNPLGIALKAATKVESDHDKLTLLVAALHQEGLSDKNVSALLKVAKSFDSDYELRTLFTAAITASGANDKTIIKLIKSAEEEIDSDFEKRTLYTHILMEKGDRKAITNALIDAADDLDSDFEKRLTFEVIIMQASLTEKQWLEVIEAADEIESDFEKAQILILVAQQAPDSKVIKKALEGAGYSTDMLAVHAPDAPHNTWNIDEFKDYMERIGDDLERSLEDVERQLEGLEDTLDQTLPREQLQVAREAIQHEMHSLQESGIKQGLKAAQLSIEKQLEQLASKVEGFETTTLRNALVEAHRALEAEMMEFEHQKAERAKERAREKAERAKERAEKAEKETSL